MSLISSRDGGGGGGVGRGGGHVQADAVVLLLMVMMVLVMEFGIFDDDGRIDDRHCDAVPGKRSIQA